MAGHYAVAGEIVSAASWILRALAISLPFLVQVAPRAEAPKPEMKPPKSRWIEIEAALGSVKLDGTLKLAYDLGDNRSLRLLGIRCALEHRVETDADARPISQWRVTGLRSSLVPRGREQLLWQPPGQASVVFERDKVGRALSDAGPADWKIREEASRTFDIRALDGRRWRYVNGLLASAEHPSLGEVRFTTKGGLIREVWVSSGRGGDGEKTLLEVRYDLSARPVELRIGERALHRFTWSPNGELAEWRRADEKIVCFEYEHGLLDRVDVEGEPPRKFRWAENAGFRRGDSRWPAPVHLTADESNTYRFELSRKGFRLTRHENATGREIVTVFNPRRYRLVQDTGNEELIVTFRKGITKRGAIERIENGEDKILESYQYDNLGQLVRLKREGDPERALSYDETGRLMAIEETSEP